MLSLKPRMKGDMLIGVPEVTIDLGIEVVILLVSVWILLSNSFTLLAYQTGFWVSHLDGS